METETLSNQEVIDFANKHLISIKLDIKDSIGKKLYGEYRGNGIPLLVFLNDEGEEIERVLGYKDYSDFLNILNDVVANTNTFMSLFEKYEKGDRSSELIDMLSAKSELKNDQNLSENLYQFILSNSNSFKIEAIERAQLYFARVDLKNGNLDKINNFILSSKNLDNIKKAYNLILRHYRAVDNENMELLTHKKLISLFPDDPSILNGYGWRMSELEKELEDALEKIDRALSILDKNESSYPHVLDTKAEILWKMGLIDEAVIIIEEAILIDEKAEYYKNQKTKFLNSKKEI